ncbi:AMP-dependent synthetase [Streptomyces albireticuli]|uniref:AMP-dependent synthetase n=1 Tax=Streptomyces albireticuli TaxID=1940 RepID=A0A1Z2L634_9ACTN|nr:AMP-binding protein [Streptomyces albireticuli]ARZ69750.1 AMP-dependent synthetase [Streptomyces albireticuli]
MIYRSPFQDIDLPGRPLDEYILDGASERGDHPALVDAVSGRTITYTELAGLVDSVAAGLADAGLKPGEVLAVYSPNSLFYPVVCLAAARAGAAVTLVNALATAKDLARQLQDAEARILFTVSALLPTVREAGGDTVREVFVLDEAEHHRSIGDLAGSGAPRPAADASRGSADIALLPYSSGTSGAAKGVVLTHGNVTANIAQMSHALEVTPDHRVLAVLPFFHAYGFSTLIGVTLRSGATLVVLPRFDLAGFLDILTGQRITHALVAPPIALALAKHPLVEGRDFSSIQQLLSAAAPLKPELAEMVHRRIGVPVVQAYGMTELSPGAHVPPRGQTPPPGSVGKPLPSTECRLVSPEDGRDVAPGEEGELWVRGPQVMRGYLGRPTETAEVVDEDGWLHTGDLARVDEDGWFFISDRVKELIKYKGYQVLPGELEAVLLTHPGVADAAVVGVVDEDGMETPRAYVVAAPGPGDGAALTAEAVMEYVAARVAPYKKVRSVAFLDALPRSNAGKILRRELRNPAAGAGRAGS